MVLQTDGQVWGVLGRARTCRQADLCKKAKVNGKLEAYVIQLACGKAPEGYAGWTLELLKAHGSTHGTDPPGNAISG